MQALPFATASPGRRPIDPDTPRPARQGFSPNHHRGRLRLPVPGCPKHLGIEIHVAQRNLNIPEQTFGDLPHLSLIRCLRFGPGGGCGLLRSLRNLGIVPCGIDRRSSKNAIRCAGLGNVIRELGSNDSVVLHRGSQRRGIPD